MSQSRNHLLSLCKQCHKVTSRAWKHAHKEKLRLQAQQYYQSNKEKILSQQTAYYLTNKEKILEKGRELYLTDRERKLEKNRAWYHGNRENRNSQTKEWSRNNSDKVRKQKRAWIEKNKKKYLLVQAAYQAVQKALKSGVLIRSDKCQDCETFESTQAHHYKGYASEHYLDVQWLCPTCHSHRHPRLIILNS